MRIYTKLPSLEISWCQHGWGCSEVKISFADVWQRSGPSTDVMALIERVEPRMVGCFFHHTRSSWAFHRNGRSPCHRGFQSKMVVYDLDDLGSPHFTELYPSSQLAMFDSRGVDVPLLEELRARPTSRRVGYPVLSWERGRDFISTLCYFNIAKNGPFESIWTWSLFSNHSYLLSIYLWITIVNPC